MSSDKSLIIKDEDACKNEVNSMDEQEHDNAAYQDNSCEPNNITSSVNISDHKIPADQVSGLEAAEVSRGGISVIASTAEAEAYLYPGVSQTSDHSFALVTEVQSASPTHLVLDQNSEQVETLYAEDSVIENEDQESTVESNEGHIDSEVTENDTDVAKSEDGFQTGGISISEVYAEDEEAVICDGEEEFAAVGDTEEEELVIGVVEDDDEASAIVDAEDEEVAVMDVTEEEEAVIGNTGKEETVAGHAEVEEIVTGDAEEEVVGYDTSTRDPSIASEIEELVEIDTKSVETEVISNAEAGDVMSQDAESVEGLENYEQGEYDEGIVTQDCDVEAEEHQTEETDPDDSHQEIEEEMTVDSQPEDQILIQEVVNTDSVIETECQDDGVIECGIDESNPVKDNDGDYVGEGEIDDDGEGEEFGGEEEEFEEGEEMGDEVEVEIEDCSDSEIEPEGGVTYIISEGMIVVEENEGSENFQPADIADVTEEEHIVCEDQLGKTTRIVIKVPSSSKSTIETESSVNPDHSSVLEAVGITELKQKSDSLVSIGKNVTLKQIDNAAQKQGEVESSKSIDHGDNVKKSCVKVEHSLGAKAIVSEMAIESGLQANVETTTIKGLGNSGESSVSAETEKLQDSAAPVEGFCSKDSEAVMNLKDGNVSGTHNGESIEQAVAVVSVAKESGSVKHNIKSGKTPKASEELFKLDKTLKESSQATASNNAKPSEKTTKSTTKNEAKGTKTVSNTKNHSTQEKNNSETCKEKRSNSSDGSRYSSKHTHSLPHKHKKQSTKLSADERSLNVTKSASKQEVVIKEDKGSKTDSMKKQTETKDSATRTSYNDSHYASKGSSSHRTRSNSTSSKESLGKDKRMSRKEDSSSKVSAVTSDGSSASKSNSESKIALRSSRLRKSQSESLSMTSNPEDEVQVKKDKGKTSETPIKPRHSERVSKATEKAIASGLISRRSKSINADKSEKQHDAAFEDHASQRRSKRKAESSPITREEVPLNKRRTTRSGEAQPLEDATVTTQSLKSARKSKSLKRRGSSPDVPPAKQAHQEDTSPKDKVTEEFVANIPKMCRICGSKNDNLLNVFGPEGRTMQLAEKVHSILPIKMREDEPLPSGVCHSCVVTLIACEKLVEKCSSIEKRLRAHFNCPAEKEAKNADAYHVEEPSISLPKPEKSIQIGPQSPQPSTKAADTPSRGDDEASVSNIKPAPSTRSSARVSAKNKLAESANKIAGIKLKSASNSPSGREEIPATKKPSVVASPESEDSPPVLEAEPPQSHVSTSNQEPSAQPPVLVPQPGKPVPELVPIPADEASNASKQRFGNTYRARMKPGQWEKIERGLEAIHGELQQDDQEEGLSDVKPFGGNITEEFHIVDLDMNVEEVPQGVPVGKSASSVTSEFHVEIPEEMPEEDTAVQQSSPKSVIDSILVDWSGDEDDVVLPQKASVASSGRKIVSGGSIKDNMNGSSLIKQVSSSSKTPCLFGDDDEGDGTSRTKLKTALPTAAPTSVIVKQESFWPEPAPGTSTTSSEKPPSDVPWKCFVCGKRGKSLSKFLEHKKLHLNDRKLVSCPKCSESFSNMGLLKAHMKAHHGDDDEDDVVELQPRQTRRKTARQEKVVDVDLAPATDGLYHCSLCLSAFTTIESLCQHKLTHSKAESPDVHKCTTCRKTFSQQKELQQHMVTHHQPTSQNLALFQCAKCDMKMSNQKEFIEHIESHSSGQQNFTCDLCNKVFDTKHKLRSHRSTVHKSTAYACHLCDKVCQKRITLIEHLRKHTGDNPFACPVCNKRFNRLANYKAHMTIHENARRYECPYCGKRFNRQSIQQRHIKTHTSEQSRKHRCRVCNLTFGLATEMFTHRKLHTREEVERATWEDEKQRLALTSFPCKVCQVSFNTVEEVLNHMPAHTDDERDIAAKLKNPRLECDICGKVLNSKRTFNAHRSSHIDGKPFVCKICSKGYSTSTGLNYHMLSHTGERPFPCTFCQKGYKNSTDLKVHMRQHTGEFPYKCNLCNKAFRSASSLQKHGFVHTNHRPFKCQFCNMSFKRENTKHNHERIHTNDRRFKCKVCSRSFIQKGACDAHEKLHFRGGTLSYLPGESTVGQSFDESPASTSSKAEKRDIYDEFEEEEFDEDDDDEDEYIIYEDEDGIDDGEGEEEEITGDLQNDLKSLTKGVFEEASKSSNGVDLPVTTLTPVPVSMTNNDIVPSVGDNSVHITIL